MKATDKIDAFKLRICNNKILQYKHIHPSSTIFHDNKTFSFALFDFEETLDLFIKKAENVIMETDMNADLTSIDYLPNVIYYSVIPWVSFTSFTNAYQKGPGEDIPRIVFGKYFEEKGNMKMPVSVEVHHALIDGYDVGLYYKYLQEEMNNITI